MTFLLWLLSCDGSCRCGMSPCQVVHRLARAKFPGTCRQHVGHHNVPISADVSCSKRPLKCVLRAGRDTFHCYKAAPSASRASISNAFHSLKGGNRAPDDCDHHPQTSHLNMATVSGQQAFPGAFAVSYR